MVVLGATGWLGMVALDLLESALGPAAFTERVSAWASRERPVGLRSGREVRVRDFGDARPDDLENALVLHFAFLTRDRVATMGADDYLLANLLITHRVLALLRGGPLALVYASSGAVYDAAGPPAAQVADNPYGAAKRLDELALRAACRDVGAACVVPRIFSVSGPYMTKPEAYALGDLILQSLRADRASALRIRAGRPVYRSYIAAADLVALSIAAALGGERDIVFDSGGEVVEVGELAEVVRRNAGRPDLPIDRTWDPAAPADRYVADSGTVERLANRFGLVLRTLPEQVAETASDLARSSR